MTFLRNLTIYLPAILGIILYVSPAAAQSPVSCGTVVAGYLDAPYAGSDWLEIVGSRVVARGSFGFSSFTMADGYQVESTPLHTAAAGGRSVFSAPRSGSAYTGNFHEVFPGRGNGDEDRWQFWIERSGSVYLRSITWNGSWAPMQNVVCYTGSSGQLVVVGLINNPGFGTDYWTFVMRRNYLI
ncbi:hypothetical protein F0U60_27260 [Archangium minus]|uniref:Uncharacterized protein n=1 Tax=Archangium minus TaxID=83450 RepID=A0ABY9WW85_9BACT|nr:hypothetical protein F0U60_27260 [Archangium minus]